MACKDQDTQMHQSGICVSCSYIPKLGCDVFEDLNTLSDGDVCM